MKDNGDAAVTRAVLLVMLLLAPQPHHFPCNFAVLSVKTGIWERRGEHGQGKYKLL